jgi:hypothetical protein
VWEEGKYTIYMYTGLLLGKLKKRDYLENRGVDGRIILKWMLKTYFERISSGLIWLRRWKTGGRFRKC